jgi:hypothetical protein
MPDIYSDTAAAVATVPYDRWWLKDPLHPELNTEIRVLGEITLRPREPQGEFDAIGRTDPITVTEGRKGWTGDIVVQCDDEDAYNALDALVSSGRVLLLVDGSLPRQWYVKFTDGQEWKQVRAVDPDGVYQVRHLHRVTLPFRTARRP